MQCLNSIERFLFSRDIHLLLEKNQEENSRNINPSIQNQFKANKSNEKEYISVPLRLFGSILNLYFYSNNPKKAYETIQSNSYTNREIGAGKRLNKNNLSRVSSIQSGNSIYLSESNLYGENENSGET